MTARQINIELNIELRAHPMVAEGQVMLVDRSVAEPSATGRRWVAYLHPATMQRLKDRWWAKQRTDAVITFAKLRAAMLRQEGTP